MSGRYRVKAALRNLKNSSFAKPVRLSKWRNYSKREEASVRALAKILPIRVLEASSFPALSNGLQTPPFYIFGNGASINSLTQDQFEEIARGVSVGINAWPLHSFVPDMYSFEFSRHSSEPDPELAFLVSRAESAARDSGRGHLLFLRPGLPAGAGAMVPLKPETHSRAFLYGRANLFSTSENALSADLDQLMIRIGRGHLSGAVLPDNGASVIRMIFLGLIAGFRNIRLLGVDLNDSPYFWYEQKFIKRHGDHRETCRRGVGASLATEGVLERPFPTSDFIIHLAHSASKILGAKITTGSKESSLAGPLEFWAVGSSS
jgi:hypothetical protein